MSNLREIFSYKLLEELTPPGFKGPSSFILNSGKVDRASVDRYIVIFLKLTCEGQTTTPLKSCSDSGRKAPHLISS